MALTSLIMEAIQQVQYVCSLALKYMAKFNAFIMCRKKCKAQVRLNYQLCNKNGSRSPRKCHLYLIDDQRYSSASDRHKINSHFNKVKMAYGGNIGS